MTDLLQLVWVQASALGLLLLGGALVIARQWNLILTLLGESREDRNLYRASMDENTRALADLASEIRGQRRDLNQVSRVVARRGPGADTPDSRRGSRVEVARA